MKFRFTQVIRHQGAYIPAHVASVTSIRKPLSGELQGWEARCYTCGSHNRFMPHQPDIATAWAHVHQCYR